MNLYWTISTVSTGLHSLRMERTHTEHLFQNWFFLGSLEVCQSVDETSRAHEHGSNLTWWRNQRFKFRDPNTIGIWRPTDMKQRSPRQPGCHLSGSSETFLCSCIWPSVFSSPRCLSALMSCCQSWRTVSRVPQRGFPSLPHFPTSSSGAVSLCHAVALLLLQPLALFASFSCFFGSFPSHDMQV